MFIAASDLFDICLQNHVIDDGIGLAGLNEASNELELPNGLDELADTLERANAVEHRILLRRRKRERDDGLGAASGCALRQVAVEVLVSILNNK